MISTTKLAFMNTNKFPTHLRSGLLAACLGLAAFATRAQAPKPFDSGSDGSLGDLVVTNKPTLVQLPPDGVLNYKSVLVTKDGSLGFIRNANNTPVYLLSQGDIVIEDGGYIGVGGGQGGEAIGGVAGPGGFDGGHAGTPTSGPGWGKGPGGGRGGAGNVSASGAGSGAFLNTSPDYASTNKGLPYGTPVLIPLIGGSGGGGSGAGGGAGGGAILLASNTKVSIRGFVDSTGGENRGNAANGGSGGAIRVVAPVVDGLPGNGRMTFRVYSRGNGGGGRVRVDTLQFNGYFDANPASAASLGSLMLTGLGPNLPRLDVVAATGVAIPEGQPFPASFILPVGSSPTQTVKVQAKNFGTKVPISVVVSPETGDPVTFPAEIDNTTANPATTDVNVTIPANTSVTLHVWTR
jgi:hypothetical protein